VTDEPRITGTAQHDAWLARTLPPVEQLATDLWSIPVPIPHSPLRYVSAYAFAVPGGLTLIDAGWNSPESWAAFTTGLASIGAAVSDVRGMLVTHMHYDHIGLAGRVREESGAWIALHQADHDLLARPDYRDPALAQSAEAALLRRLGATEDEALSSVGTVEAYRPWTSIALPDRHLAHGELADVPGWSLRAVHTPGHTPGHLCFHEERTRTLFAGDHVLPRITPNISVERAGTDDPLGDYLSSLAHVRGLDVQHVFPAHEWRFDGLAPRVDEILAHHERRLAELLDATAHNPGATPWELAAELTWSRPWSEYGGRMRIFAVTETAAHANLLHSRAGRHRGRGRAALHRDRGPA